MNLSITERWMISNQLRILEALYPKDSSDLAIAREAIESGYELNYDWSIDHIYKETLSKDACLEVISILEMFTAMKRAFEALNDKSGINPSDIVFEGFDGNEETKQVGYTRYLVEKEDRFTELGRGHDNFNTHCPSIGRYRRMLGVWNSSQKKHQLTKDELVQVLAA